MSIELTTQDRPLQPEPSCWSRIYSSCMRYCYFAPQPGVRAPTNCERLASSFGGLCRGIFVGALSGGFISTTEKICTQNGVPISEGLFLKILIPIISTPPIFGIVQGALHPPRAQLITADGFEPLHQVRSTNFLSERV